MTMTLGTILTAINGICWIYVYLELIYRGIKDKTYGMPLFALALNISWEFIFGFLFESGSTLQKAFNIIWFLLDIGIVYIYFRYGKKDYPKSLEKFFVPWSLVAFLVSFGAVYFAAIELGYPWGIIYSGFTMNLVMAILFISMLVRRNGVDGQSIYTAILKWFGVFGASIQAYFQTGNKLVLILGIGIFIYDLIYIVMLYHKFIELKINPFTRKPMS